MPSPAAKVAGWWDQVRSWPGLSTLAGTPPVPPFPQSPLDIGVQIYVDSSWIDVTPFVYGGGRAEIIVTRGKANEAGKVDPSVASFQLNNRDGQFSPRNPTSWLYGKIGRNTLVRISIGADIRFSGEISEWPARWDKTGTDIYVPVQASGILRRLTQGATPLKSTLYRGITSLSPGPVAYWPVEDADGSTSIASGIGGPPMNFTGTPGLAQFSDFNCAAPIALFNGSEWTGSVPTYTLTTGNAIQVWFLLHVPAGGATNGVGIMRLLNLGTLYQWTLTYTTAGGGGITVTARDQSDTLIVNSANALNLNGKLLRVALKLGLNGADVDWELSILEVGTTVTIGNAATAAGQTVGRVTSVSMNLGGGLTDVAVGHLAVHNVQWDLLALEGELRAWVGETAGRRVERLCGEEGIAFRGVGDLNATAAMGPQLPDELVNLLHEAETADTGILYEPREEFGLAYRTRERLYNQPATLVLDYAQAHLSSIEPTDDDQNVRNDITANRTGGSSFRAVQESGPLSVQTPPAGVGRYDTEVTLNLRADSQLDDAAGWLRHLGTVDEARYPVLSVDLARQVFVDDSALAATAQRLDVGDRLTIGNPPAWLPPDDITQLAQGFAETLGNFTHRIDINCLPETPWGQAAVYDDAVSRYESDGTTLNEDLDAAETAVDVAVTGRAWSHADGDFDIKVGGEVMTVTAISGTTSPQTFTVTRSVNGVVKTHSAGAEVALRHPVVYVR